MESYVRVGREGFHICNSSLEEYETFAEALEVRNIFTWQIIPGTEQSPLKTFFLRIDWHLVSDGVAEK